MPSVGAAWRRAIFGDPAAVRRSARPRILILVGSFPGEMVGGAQVQAERAAAELSTFFDVVVLSRSLKVAAGVEERATYQVLRRPVVPCDALRPFVDVILAAWQVLRIGRPLVCLVGYQTIVSGLVAVIAGRLLGVPSLVCIRGDAEFTADLDRPAVRVLSRLTWMLADRILVQTPMLAQQFGAALERVGLARTKLWPKVGVVPNGIDVLSAGNGQGQGLVFVGRLHETKGLDVLVEALRQMPRTGRPAVVIVGDGPLKADLQRDAAELPLRLIGETSREQALEYMRESAAFVFPVTSDGMSNAVMEAMAMGIPVIASRVAGLPDLIVDGENGLLVPPRDPAALRLAIETLMASPELRARLGSAGRRAVALHSWARSRRDLENQIALARAARRSA